MENKKTIEAIRDFIMTAEKSIKNANKLLKTVLEEEGVTLSSSVTLDASDMNSYMSEDAKIVE
jgi:hypothetical protein